MSRKRTPKQESTETTTTVAEAPAAEAPAPETPVTEVNENSQSFADRVGQRKFVPAPDPFGIAKDNIAGVRLFESREDHQVAIMFGQGRPEDKPSQEVINTMKEAGFRWNSADRIWAHPVWPDTARSTRIDAERLYQQVCKMIRQEKGIEAGQEVSF